MSACVALFSIYIWVSVKETLVPNGTFKEIHEEFGVIPLIPKVLLTPFEIKWTYGVLWAPPIATLIVFGFFSHNSEVAKDFKQIFFWLSRRLSLMLWYVVHISPALQLLITSILKAAKGTTVPIRIHSSLHFRIEIRKASKFLLPLIWRIVLISFS
jgi:hypothetical protein